jgi:plastocyanin
MLTITSSTAVRRALLLAVAAGALLLGARSTAAQETVTIAVGDIWFCDASYQAGVCEITIDAGDTVVWDFSGAILPHTTTACGETCDTPTGSPLWDSGIISDGGTFAYTFSQAGIYPYFCKIHPFQRGRIDVHEGARPATPTLVVISPPVDYVGTPQPTPGPGLPDVGGGPQAGDGWAWLAGVALAAIATSALGGAALLRSGRRRGS